MTDVVSGAAVNVYRPEVDGLRAFAVLAVLFFHVGLGGFGGGFVGVDVFFVISGYLITRLILGELESERFTFSRFYGRRARRLFPAMFATLAATLVAGIVILAPIHLEELALSLIYALLSLSNVLFWQKAGYFDTASQFKPLLHTWSLGVEEQFYLVWPASVVLAYRLRRRSGVLALVVIVGMASLLAAEFVARTHPVAAFYLLPFRMWELALGAACLWLELAPAAPPWLREALTLLGLGAIACAVYSYTPAHRFPGFAAILPCAGAALVIVAGRAPLSGALLANRLAVGIGLISYSLYLVHWPLLTFWRYGRSGDLGVIGRGTIVIGSIAISAAMYFLVERRFRKHGLGARKLSDPAFGLACAGLALALVLPSATALSTGGWPDRVDKHWRALTAQIPAMQKNVFEDVRRQEHVPFPAASRSNAMIVGDSHGADLLTGLLRAGSKVNYRNLHIQWFCQPILGERPYGAGTPIKSREIAEKCRQEGELLRDNAQLQAADVIVIATTWETFGLKGLPATIDYLKAHYHARIVVFGARFFLTDPSALLMQVWTPEEANRRFDASKTVADTQKEADRLSSIAEHAGVEFVDLRRYACDRQGASWSCPLLDDKGELLYVDFHHWSAAGALRVGSRLRESGRYPFLF